MREAKRAAKAALRESVRMKLICPLCKTLIPSGITCPRCGADYDVNVAEVCATAEREFAALLAATPRAIRILNRVRVWLLNRYCFTVLRWIENGSLVSKLCGERRIEPFKPFDRPAIRRAEVAGILALCSCGCNGPAVAHAASCPVSRLRATSRTGQTDE